MVPLTEMQEAVMLLQFLMLALLLCSPCGCSSLPGCLQHMTCSTRAVDWECKTWFICSMPGGGKKGRAKVDQGKAQVGQGKANMGQDRI